jgi:hypothetical protein
LRQLAAAVAVLALAGELEGPAADRCPGNRSSRSRWRWADGPAPGTCCSGRPSAS